MNELCLAISGKEAKANDLLGGVKLQANFECSDGVLH